MSFTVLVLSYDIEYPEESPYGQNLLILVDKLRQSGLNVRTHSPDILNSDASRMHPNMIISQQYGIGPAEKLAQQLKVPFVVIFYRMYEYQYYQNIQADLILTQSEDLQSELSKMTQTNIINSFDAPEFLDLISYKISVIVPCHGRHIFELNRLFQNFSEFTQRPYEVIVSISLDKDQQLLDVSSYMSELLSTYQSKFNLKLHLSLQGLSAAQNRNLAAQQSKGDILVYLDADDVYHTQLIEIIRYVWKNYSVVNLHWKYTREPDLDHQVDFEKLQFVDSNELDRIFMKNKFDAETWAHQIAYGHGAMSRKVWKQIPFDEIIHSEDVSHHITIYRNYPKENLWLDCILSIYQQERSLGTSFK